MIVGGMIKQVDYKARCEALEIEKADLEERLERCSASRLKLKQDLGEMVRGVVEGLEELKNA